MTKEPKAVGEDAVKTTAAAAPAVGPAAKKPRSASLYLGPNRAYGLPLMRNQVFTCDGPPPICHEAIKAHPHFAACFVSVSGAGRAYADLQNPDSALSRAMKKVMEESAALRAEAKGGKA
ncbi:hypothetical protein LJC15_00205 [Desulfovibrio sp. OttesenSCG-928-G11]|nr:hypothetical protein [Desulfovibrio sp. OttesenSCG-928-G11]